MGTNANRRAGTPATLTLRLDHLRGDAVIVHASGRLDRATALRLRQLLDDQLAAAPRAIVLDLTSVSVVEPDGVETLDYVARRAGEADIGLGLVTVDGAVIRALATAGVDALFDVYPSTEAARRALT
ncbi:STAS domain-containing protein [Pseudonocardia acidicola]|uniref:STAS domain-containing protein n=1 Tax=Pseudonocardia acidicola TaxID=2724939 RepID=UPI001EF0A8AF|nr:STAS domain-containing protein [Pseudonocardia acidicola]